MAFCVQLLFVGINPGLCAAAVSQRFGQPGSRLQLQLCRYAAGFSHRLLAPPPSLAPPIRICLRFE